MGPVSFSSDEHYGSRWCASSDNLLEGIRDSLGNQLTMKTAILDKYLVSMHAGNDYTREINAITFALQSLWVGSGTLRLRLQRDPGGVEEREIRLIPDERKNEIVLEQNFAFGCRDSNRIWQNFEHA